MEEVFLLFRLEKVLEIAEAMDAERESLEAFFARPFRSGASSGNGELTGRDVEAVGGVTSISTNVPGCSLGSAV